MTADSRLVPGHIYHLLKYITKRNVFRKLVVLRFLNKYNMDTRHWRDRKKYFLTFTLSMSATHVKSESGLSFL